MSRSLTDAVKAGNIAEVEIRLNMGEDIDQLEPPKFLSPLHWAVAGDHLSIANLLKGYFICYGAYGKGWKRGQGGPG